MRFNSLLRSRIGRNPRPTIGPIGGIFGKAPLRGPPPLSPPREDQAEHFPCRVDLKLRGSGCRGVRSGDALAGGVVFEPVKRAHEAAVAHLAAGGRAKLGSQVRAYRIGHADAPIPVAPGDDFLSHPGLLNQLLFQQGVAAGNEVPPLGERGKRVAWSPPA